ncbi:hypothetical protein DR64_6891 [Paraburkholderia xenovorans LB400]|uniref:DUF5672 domain-containing protein n=1 Tax=Paraburkholderia xenovorans (strain LB400) TaxID=266265 RepID=Q13NG3_PARXL|nr:hypothetical protein Bxe_B1588 [Paraburkholderia xenovorans LB400]AIP37387.1 hypothetical protein DR64_6891 [Paraburkholderia xenovorans LB400]
MSSNFSTVDLGNVTLCAADSINPAFAARALETSAARCNFADAILFTHEAVPTSVRTVLIPRLRSKEDYSAFMVKHLLGHVTTPWVLVVQWDGYVLDPAAWSETFFDYDYIGAYWPFHRDGMNVGNGGFSLRSTKLLQALADERFALLPGVNEDDLICRVYRPLLETGYGIRFAPAAAAARFAYEHVPPDRPTFGFHAAFNMWRHVDDATLMEKVRALDLRTYSSNEVLMLLTTYCDQRKFDCMKVMYERYRHLWSAQEIVHNMMMTGVAGETALRYVEMCESLLKNAFEGLGK